MQFGSVSSQPLSVLVQMVQSVNSLSLQTLSFTFLYKASAYLLSGLPSLSISYKKGVKKKLITVNLLREGS